MTRPTLVILVLAAGVATAAVRLQPPQSSPSPPPSQQPSELELTISGEAGAPPRFAVPDFLAPGGDAGLAAVARTIGQVLWDERDRPPIRACTRTRWPTRSTSTSAGCRAWRGPS
jgi:hypothetical protein